MQVACCRPLVREESTATQEALLWPLGGEQSPLFALAPFTIEDGDKKAQILRTLVMGQLLEGNSVGRAVLRHPPPVNAVH